MGQNVISLDFQAKTSKAQQSVKELCNYAVAANAKATVDIEAFQRKAASKRAEYYKRIEDKELKIAVESEAKKTAIKIQETAKAESKAKAIRLQEDAKTKALLERQEQSYKVKLRHLSKVADQKLTADKKAARSRIAKEVNAIDKKGVARRTQIEKDAEKRLALWREGFLEKARVKEEMRQERVRQRALTKTKTWSQKMLTQFSAVNVAIWGRVAGQVSGFAKSLANDSLEMAGATQAASVSFERLAEKSGVNATLGLEQLQRATGGAMSRLQQMQTAAKSVNAGLQFDNLITAMEYVRRYAESTGDDFESRWRTTMTGLVRGSANFLDDVGINVMGSKDVVGDAIIQMKEKMDSLGVSGANAGVGMRKLSAATENLKIRTGELIQQRAGDLFERMAAALNRIGKSRLDKTLQDLRDLGVEAERIMDITREQRLQTAQAEIDKQNELLAEIKRKASALNQRINAMGFGKDAAGLDKWTASEAKQFDQLKARLVDLKDLKRVEAEIERLRSVANEKNSSEVLNQVLELRKIQQALAVIEAQEKRINKIKDEAISRDTNAKEIEKAKLEIIASELKTVESIAKAYNSGNISIYQALSLTTRLQSESQRLLDTQNLLNAARVAPVAGKDLKLRGSTGTPEFPVREMKRPEPPIPTNQLAKDVSLVDKLAVLTRNQYADLIQQGQALTDVFTSATQARLQNELNAIQIRKDAQSEAWQQEMEFIRAAGLEGTRYHQQKIKEQQAAAKKIEAEELKVQSKTFEQKKKADALSVVSNTAVAIMKAYGQTGIFATLYTGLIAATGAAQLAMISGQKNPYKRREGGWIPGSGVDEDSQLTALSPGEFVLRRPAAKKYAPLLEPMNRGELSFASASPRQQVIKQEKHVHLTVNIENVIGEEEWVQNRLVPSIQKAVQRGEKL